MEYVSPRALELAGCEIRPGDVMSYREALEVVALHRSCERECPRLRRALEIRPPTGH